MYLTPTANISLPEQARALKSDSTFTLKPGQLAIVSSQGIVQMQAVTDQLILSWDILPKFCFPLVLWKFGDGINISQSVEEILYNLWNENKYNDEEWFLHVKTPVLSLASSLSQQLEQFDGRTETSGLCPSCNRHFYLYSVFCPQCNLSSCIWCNFHITHKHRMLFVRANNFY